MKALIKSNKSLIKWLRKLTKSLWKRARKEGKKYKEKPPKPTAWEIIKGLTVKLSGSI